VSSQQLDVGLLSYQQARRQVEAGAFKFLASTGAAPTSIGMQLWAADLGPMG